MIEHKLIPKFPHEIIATDEVGRGPLSGPVVIGAVRLIAEDLESLKKLLKFLKLSGVNDSKKLSSSERLKILEKLGFHLSSLREKNVARVKGIEISYVTWDMCNEVIDRENILAASLRGMKESVQCLSFPEKCQTTVLIDGPHKFRWINHGSPWNEVPIIKGDSKSPLIGLASILAKEKRDDFMRRMHELYPNYGFNSHYGYPTKEHRRAIAEYGPSPIHRKSFKGVKEFIGTSE